MGSLLWLSHLRLLSPRKTVLALQERHWVHLRTVVPICPETAISSCKTEAGNLASPSSNMKRHLGQHCNIASQVVRGFSISKQDTDVDISVRFWIAKNAAKDMACEDVFDDGWKDGSDIRYGTATPLKSSRKSATYSSTGDSPVSQRAKLNIQQFERMMKSSDGKAVRLVKCYPDNRRWRLIEILHVQKNSPT